jgi:DNA processing protein
MDEKKLEWKERQILEDLKLIKPVIKNLYYLGEWTEELFENCVAVIGSRRITEYGKRVIEKIVPELVLSGKTIVSGFMYGVDQYAHNQAILCGGKTIAVLGYGFEWKMDAREKDLADRIVEGGGLIMTEWRDQQPALWTYPMRNRIVAGLCREIIVIEAAQKSGSMITVDWGRKLNKKIWAVPGSIFSMVSKGTNWLIENGIAKMWLGEDGWQKEKKKIVGSEILEILINEELTVDEIARKLGKKVEEVGVEVSILLLKGDLKERGGKYYVD